MNKQPFFVGRVWDPNEKTRVWALFERIDSAAEEHPVIRGKLVSTYDTREQARDAKRELMKEEP